LIKHSGIHQSNICWGNVWPMAAQSQIICPLRTSKNFGHPHQPLRSLTKYWPMHALADMDWFSVSVPISYGWPYKLLDYCYHFMFICFWLQCISDVLCSWKSPQTVIIFYVVYSLPMSDFCIYSHSW
jgi:hypothetical protein